MGDLGGRAASNSPGCTTSSVAGPYCIEDPPRWVKKVERSVSYPLPVTRRAAALSIPALTTLALLASAKGADLLTPQMTGEAPAAGKRVLKTPTNSHRP
jgi:hypothetical protein